MQFKLKIKIMAFLFIFAETNSCPTELGKKLLVMNKISYKDISDLNQDAISFKSTGASKQ